MKPRKRLTAKKAAKQLKVGDEVWLKARVYEIGDRGLVTVVFAGTFPWGYTLGSRDRVEVEL